MYEKVHTKYNLSRKVYKMAHGFVNMLKIVKKLKKI